MANQHGDGSGSGDRTILKPRPGAGRAAQPPAQSAPPRPAPPPAAELPGAPQEPATFAAPPPPPSAPRGLAPMTATDAAAGLDPLVAAAAPALALAGRLRHAAEGRDPATLRQQLVAEVRTFEERAKAAGVAVDQVAAARYALCATIDEAVLSTPWGARGDWGTQPLLSIFHRETWGGEKFFQLLDRTRADPHTYAGLLELLYTCVSLGFTGKYALDTQGPMQRDRLQHELFEQLRSLRGTPAQPLSPRWQGVRDRRNPLLRYVPLWVVAAAAVALLAGGYLYFRIQLGRSAEPVLTALSQVGMQDLTAPASATPPPVTLKQLLADLEQQGSLAVEEQGARSVVTLSGGDLFAPGSATINPRFDAVLDRVGAALEDLPGPVLVVGHSDSQPIRSFRYQNNFELSSDRALAVLHRLEKSLSAPARLQANGVGSTQPRYNPPDTPENRAKNRRVEIVHVSSGDVS